MLFKIITKTMVERLKPLMTNLIGPAQASFIPGRVSTDNIVLVQEAVHSMRRKKGVKGWMLLKLDLEKAYDRIRWDYLEDTLISAGFPEVWVRWIMCCVSGPEMSLLWNGERTDSFKPLQGRHSSRAGPSLEQLERFASKNQADLETCSGLHPQAR